MKTTSASSYIALAFFGICSLLSGRAHAAATFDQVVNCKVTAVAYFNDQLIITCSGTIINQQTGAGTPFTGNINASGPSATACGERQSSDSLKAFVSIAQSAFLSGRHLDINYYDDSACAGGNALIYLREF